MSEQELSIELVVWIDSSSMSGWTGSEEAKANIWRCQSVGFLIDETDTAIALAESRSEPKAEHKPYADIISIPKVAIISRSRLHSVPKEAI